MTSVIDLEELRRAGVRDPEGRRALLDYLDELGFTADQLADADRHGRLFALAGDALIESGPREFSLRTAAAAIGRPLDEVEHAWGALGLTAAGVDDVALSRADVEGLRTWSDLDHIVGAEFAMGVLRVLGACMARFAEAESAAIRAGVPAVQIDYTADELTTARAFASVATFVPRIGALIDAVHRQQLVSARVHFEGVLQDTSATAVCGIGFVDLCGFTALTRQLSPAELSYLLGTFSSTVSDVVHADGGRLVKFIGDAVMWVSKDAERLATAAADLVQHARAREAGLQVRAGIAYGPALARDGDYFGVTVNLAARLVGAAQPGQILATAEVRDAVPHWPATSTGPLTLRGFDETVEAFAILPEG